tara:strand:+ start:997 stop:1800 length:804 start_codon:yes stop_codon:yes gene_type:complete
MYSSTKRRRIKPFARTTSFDINVAFDIRHFQRVKYGNVIDPYFPAVGTTEAFQVMEGEILMQTQKPNVRRYGDHQMHVFSFANGLEGSDMRLNASAPGSSGPTAGDGFIEKGLVMENLKYAGVAVTEFKPEVDIFEQGFVMTVAGLNTLFNSGANTLYPGDIICADIPNPADKGKRKNRALQTGIPHEKLQFVVTPYSKLETQIGSKLASRFIMGTALSYSKPGAPVDVVLHKCNVIQTKAPRQIALRQSASASAPPATKKEKGKRK